MDKIGGPGLPSGKRQQVWEMRKAGHTNSETARSVAAPTEWIFSILLSSSAIIRLHRKQYREGSSMRVPTRGSTSRCSPRPVAGLLSRIAIFHVPASRSAALSLPTAAPLAYLSIV